MSIAMATTPTRDPRELQRRRARAARRRREEQKRRRVRAVVAVTGTLLALGGAYGFLKVRQSGGLKQTAKGILKSVSGPAAIQATERADEPLVVFRDALGEGWDDWSWATHDKASVAMAARGTIGVQMTLKGSDGIYFHHNPLTADGYGALEFLFKGTASTVMATLFDENNKPRRQLTLTTYLVHATGLKPGWQQVRIPLKAFGIGGGDKISGVVLQCATPTASGTVGFDEILLTPDTSLPAPATELTIPVSVDAKAETRPISRLIYGVAHASRQEVETLGATLNRWGGNPNSRHNWVLNAWNSASDWEFRNHGPEGAPVTTPGGAADAFIRDSAAVGAQTYMTVPTLGWVARNTDIQTKSEKVPWNAASGYDPAENRRRTSVRSVARKGRGFTENPTPGETIYQDEWIFHLLKTHGASAPHFYAMDNEPDLWSFTHRDVHPGQMGYDETLRNFLEYASAVKEVDKSAQIAGPTVSGWTSYFSSALDRGNDNFGTSADRKAHGNTPFLLWFLQQARAHDQQKGKGRRSLDILDVHYYPQGQGVYSETSDPATRALRLRSVRSLWDPSYKDESWIANTADGPHVRLIPRLKEWVAQGYPGTKLAIGEWSFGGEADISGGLATAEALGVFGREGVDIAAYWTRPKLGTPAAAAFQLFRHPEAGLVGFGDLSCQALSSQSDRLAVFAATDNATGALTLILINKLPKATVTVPLTVKGHDGGPSRLWRFSSEKPGELVASEGPTVENGKATLTLPPYSATLVRVGGRKSP